MCHVQSTFICLAFLQTITSHRKQSESWKVIQTVAFLGNDEKCKTAKNEELVFIKSTLKLSDRILSCYACTVKDVTKMLLGICNNINNISKYN
jgi:hypothetical protein